MSEEAADMLQVRDTSHVSRQAPAGNDVSKILQLQVQGLMILFLQVGLEDSSLCVAKR